MSYISENFETQTAGGYIVSRETLGEIVERMSLEEFKSLIYNISISMTNTEKITAPLYGDIMSHTPDTSPTGSEAFFEGTHTVATFNHNLSNGGILIVPLACTQNFITTSENTTSPSNMNRISFTHQSEITEFYNSLITGGVNGFFNSYRLIDYNWSNLVALVKVKYYTSYSGGNYTVSDWVDFNDMPEGAKIAEFNTTLYYGEAGERGNYIPFAYGNISFLAFSDYVVNNTPEWTNVYSQKRLTSLHWAGYGYKLLPIGEGGGAQFDRLVWSENAITGIDEWAVADGSYTVQATEIVGGDVLKNDGNFTRSYIDTDTLLQLVNQLGTIWTGSLNHINDDLTSDYINMPIIGIDGASGTNTSGESNTQNGLWGKTDIGGGKNWKLPENPEEDVPDPNTYTDVINFGTPALTPINLFCGYYAMSYNEVLALNDYLWNTDETIYNAILNSLKLMGNNPINFLSNLKLYPFDLSNYGTLTNKNIIVGRIDTGLTGGQLPSNYHVSFDLGSCYIYPYNKDFSDYTNTRMFIYLPFIGSREIEATEFMNKTLTAKYVVDILTGACTCGVFADGIPMFYADGIIGVDIPITADNSHELYSNVLQSTLGTVTAGFNKDVGGVINGLDNMWTSTAVTPQKTGASSPTCAHSLPLKAYVVVERCKEEIPANYGSRVGFLYNKQIALSDCRGFTVCENFECDIPNILSNEYEMLVNLFNKGVRF